MCSAFLPENARRQAAPQRSIDTDRWADPEFIQAIIGGPGAVLRVVGPRITIKPGIGCTCSHPFGPRQASVYPRTRTGPVERFRREESAVGWIRAVAIF